jgi:ABC-type molybdate transport system ATPase subunit
MRRRVAVRVGPRQVRRLRRVLRVLGVGQVGQVLQLRQVLEVLALKVLLARKVPRQLKGAEAAGVAIAAAARKPRRLQRACPS